MKLRLPSSRLVAPAVLLMLLASDATDHFQPILARSVGLGPVSSPPQGAFEAVRPPGATRGRGSGRVRRCHDLSNGRAC